MPETHSRVFGHPYQRRDLVLNLSGPLIRNRLTATFSYRRNESEEGDTLQAITPDGLINDAITRPQSNREYTVRATTQLSESNVLNFSYGWGDQAGRNQNVGGFGLPEQGLDRSRDNYTFQIKETAVLSSRFNHEVRFRVNEFTDRRIPLTTGVHILVRDAFARGGATQKAEFGRKQYEFGNLLMFTGSSLAIRVGYDGGHERIGSNSEQNFNGTFEFATLDDFVAGIPSRYTVSRGNPMQRVSQFQSAAFLQSDWRVRPNLTLYFGGRYEWQENIDDNNNLDPPLRLRILGWPQYRPSRAGRAYFTSGSRFSRSTIFDGATASCNKTS